jgi:hypothetical protein
MFVSHVAQHDSSHATLIPVRRSTPLTLMAIAAPKLRNPSARATTNRLFVAVPMAAGWL